MMALWKSQTPSTTLLSFRQDGVIYEVEWIGSEDYRLSIGNLFTFRSSKSYASLTAIVQLANRIANADSDKQRKAIVDKEF
jgi:hypothetical protein